MDRAVPTESPLTPRDLLDSIIEAMEATHIEGLDGRIYVPNRFILTIGATSAEERAYLLSFLDEEELSSVIERYLAHRNLTTRGPLDFTIEEIDPTLGGDPLVVRALFDRGSPPMDNGVADKTLIASPLDIDDPPTVAAYDLTDDEDGTVAAIAPAWGALLVQGVDGERSIVSISKPVFLIGRSRHGGNDLVLNTDGQVSKRHLRLELEPDGGVTLYDLASTNGTSVNGRIVPVNVALRHGDEIVIGGTCLVFHKEHVAEAPAAVPPPAPRAARLTESASGYEHFLGTVTLIGRGITCNITIDQPTVSMHQARITKDDKGIYQLVDLSGRGTTRIEGRVVRVGERIPLNDGDTLVLGGVTLIFNDK
jgi:pSer/pThr/pTyr-binding forkhead associated (FHA) protein